MAHIHISPKFKDTLLSIEWFIKNHLWIEDFDNARNESLAVAISLFIIRNNIILYTKDWNRLRWSVLWTIRWIDLYYIWTDRELYLREPLLQKIKTIYVHEDPLFDKWEILKFKSGEEICRLMENVDIDMSKLVSEYVECIWYEGQYTVIFSWWKTVYVKNTEWTIVWVPQSLLTGSDVVSLEGVIDMKIKNTIRLRIEDNRKYKEEEINNLYRLSLREFMENAKKLWDFLSEDLEIEVDKQYENIRNLSSILEKHNLVDKVIFIPNESITIYTRNIYSEWNYKYPLWRYRIYINLINYSLNIKNTIVDVGGVYHHPHINHSWDCCLWEYATILSKLYKAQDYIGYWYAILEYLQSYYPGSVYQSRDSFVSNHKPKLDQSIQDEHSAKIKETEIIVDWVSIVWIELNNLTYIELDLEKLRNEYQLLWNSTPERVARSVPSKKADDYMWIMDKIQERAKWKSIWDKYMIYNDVLYKQYVVPKNDTNAITDSFIKAIDNKVTAQQLLTA